MGRSVGSGGGDEVTSYFLRFPVLRVTRFLLFFTKFYYPPELPRGSPILPNSSFSGKPLQRGLSRLGSWNGAVSNAFSLSVPSLLLKRFIINFSSSASAWAFDRSLVISTLLDTAGRSLGSLCCWASHYNWFGSLITQTFPLNNSAARVWKMASAV